MSNSEGATNIHLKHFFWGWGVGGGELPLIDIPTPFFYAYFLCLVSCHLTLFKFCFVFPFYVFGTLALRLRKQPVYGKLVGGVFGGWMAPLSNKGGNKLLT